jgi:hypothetical protein
MLIIYYIVSGEVMELLQFLSSFLSKNSNLKCLAPILEYLSNNSFDLKKALANLSPQALAPVIESLSWLFKNQNPTSSNFKEVGLKPITAIADKDISYCLNRYFLSD